ncbi:hemolysin family protein [Pedobacter sp. L105]|uniref:hemolysin family protein n=1 Tax=Pedobacter sp. L105 TaxID=1641871 RepID=UPI00131C11A9|nr:hemolysin family protein [Pedobacter sp. L105]
MIIIILIILNGYFSLAEMSLISVKNAELADEQSKNNPKAFQVLQLIKVPEEFLSAIQVGATLLGLLEGIFGGGMVAAQLDHWFLLLGMSSFVAHIAGLVIGIGAVTYLSLVFGELVPQSIALQMPLRVSLAIAPSLVIFSKVLYPFIKLLTASTRFILSALSIKKAGHKKISEKDLKGMLGTAYKQGLLGKQQLWMHENLFAFDDLKARNIMKPARIVICLSNDWTREQVIEAIRKRPYSYFPVYQDDPSHIIGVLHVKEFFLNETAEWHQSINYNCAVPENAAVRDVFNIFKEKKVDFGMVVDEGKKFLGVIAMQDIMEGVFGDIPELEDYKAYLYEKSDNVWIAENFIHLQRIRNTLNLNWLRDYEAKYLSLADLFAGETALLTDDGTITLNGVTFEIIAGSKDNPQTIQIKLPAIKSGS